MITVGPAPLALAVDIINGWSSLVRVEAGIADEQYPSLGEVLRSHAWDGQLIDDPELSTFADSMHEVFALGSSDARLEALNALIAKQAPTPILTPAGPRWAIDGTHRGLEASLLLAVCEHARSDPSLLRLGSCSAERCVDVYHDSTQAHVRRYCSLTCQNRAKAAAYRRRHRAGAASASSSRAGALGTGRAAPNSVEPTSPSGAC